MFASCSGDDSPDEAYAFVESASFTFDESVPANNAVRVKANTAWTAYWTPAATDVALQPASGSGDGTFYVRDMPEGTRVEIGVRTASGDVSGRLITVTRAPRSDDVTLLVSPSDLLFDPSAPRSNVIYVETNASWSAVCPDPGLKFSPVSGSGNATITVTDAPAGRRCTLTVTAGTGAKQETVEILREADAPSETVFNLDFGNGAGGVWAGSDAAWKTQTGTGAGAVSYSVNNVRINNDGFNSANKYAGASGKAYAKMFYNAETDYFVIQRIALPAGQTDFTLTFGAIFPPGDVSLSISADGAVWRPLTYTAATTYNVWTKAAAGFSLKEPVERLSIRFAPTGTERQYGLNFDDIVLTTGGGGQEVDLTGAAALRWAELPSDFETPSADQFVHTTWTTTVTSNVPVRNYTYCYDTRRHNPVWVAYPHHRCYLEGAGRSDEPWAADPALDESLQSKIYGTSPDDYFQYWTADLVGDRYGSGYWSRGHLCMSRERPGSGLEINVQTFRPTNVAPQASAPSPFGAIWSNVETVISGGTIPADTLYIVAGCYYDGDNWIEHDASNNGVLGPGSKACIMPTHQFKMAVRKKTVQVGKPIQECTADELQTIAFWVETLTQSSATTLAGVEQFIVPVHFVEEKMGVTFFPDIPAAAKSREGSLSEWGY